MAFEENAVFETKIASVNVSALVYGSNRWFNHHVHLGRHPAVLRRR